MLYMSLRCADLGAPEFIGAEPVDRATWICLIRYCAEQENGGVIRDCADWKDRQWQQAAGVFLAEVERTCALWIREGKSIRVWAYPIEQQEKYEAARKSGKKGAKKRWGKPGSGKPPTYTRKGAALVGDEVRREKDA
jgi:hypothetical protein